MTMRQQKRAAVAVEMHMHPCKQFLHAITMKHDDAGEIESHNAAINALVGLPSYNNEIIRSLTQKVTP